ncbi:hypothetical protein U6010_11065 [Pseudomonas aeruginosa]|uniref:hypothetical protein n=1 Tax=Pseudomonas aeruginosa TaxID=287 RepID=UPI002ADD9011|nr:hypothetical protein [Pseudomonas aeruginosa]MEA0988981.1 hypothetical protein [Pseudomonas aeruginosa]
MKAPNEEKVDLAKLKARFGDWCVPSDLDFKQLIAVATLSFRPGDGLKGGDGTSGKEGFVELSQVTPFEVNAGLAGGMIADKDGLAVQIAAEGGLAFDGDKRIGLEPAGDKSISIEGGLAVQAVAPLRVGDVVAVDIDESQGLTWIEQAAGKKALSLKVDQKTIDVDKDKVFIKCKPDGGLMVEPTSGCLTIDVAAILKR